MDDGAPRADAGLISDLEASDIHPLWDRYKRITPITPAPDDPPFVWRWKDIDPFTARAATEIAMEDAERRALIMAHPAFDGETKTTHNLLSAFTVLEPGDKALPHRHTAAAIRFSTRAEGAVTIVNGRRCEMLPGDLVLTPPWCWHGHINESDHRIMWFDAANIPLINDLDVNPATVRAVATMPSGKWTRETNAFGRRRDWSRTVTGTRVRSRRNTDIPGKTRAACWTVCVPAKTARSCSATSIR